MFTQEIGSLKKPAWLVRTLKNPLISREEKERARDDAAYLNIRMLEDLGLDIVYDGEARRVEMYEYPIRRMGGFKFAARVRSFDNRYYRKARCISQVEYKGPYHLEEFKKAKSMARAKLKVPITGPYTLVDWSFNEYYKTKEDFCLDMAKAVIRPNIAELVKAGAEIIQIDEPAATAHPSEMKMFREALNASFEGLDGKMEIHICYSGNNYRDLFPHVLDIKCQQLLLEFANRDSLNRGLDEGTRKGYSAIKTFKDYAYSGEIGLGVVDVHIDEVETPEIIRDRILYACKVLGDPSKIYVNPDCGLRTRSKEIAVAKLANMVRGTRLAEKALQ